MTQIQESPPTEKSDIHSEEEVQSRNNFAAMNGVNIEIEADDSHLSSVPEPEEIITTRAVSQNPLLKMGVIGGGIFVFIILIGGVISSSMNALNMVTSKKIEPEKNSEEVDKAEVKNETGETKTALALTSQNVEFQKIRDKKAEATPTPTPTFTPVAVAPAPTTRTIPQRTQPVTVSRNPIPPFINNPPLSPTRGYQPRAMPIAREIRAIPGGTVKTPTQDPMQQWLAAANVGSFSANSTSTTDDDLKGASGIEGGTGRPLSPSDNILKKTDKLSQKKEPEKIDYGRVRVLVGSRAEGKLETPIAWSGNTENQSNQNYIIQLSKPLFASDGSEALPKGSYIVAQVSGQSQSEYMQLQAVSALVNSNGNTEEKSLPEGAILILAKNGRLLKGESRQGRDIGRTLFSSVLAGVAKAAEITNRPSSQITTNYDGFSSSTTSNDNKDLVAGFAEGTLGEIVRGIQSQNQQQAQQLQGEEKVFVIEAGQSVQIFVNQTINL